MRVSLALYMLDTSEACRIKMLRSEMKEGVQRQIASKGSEEFLVPAWIHKSR